MAVMTETSGTLTNTTATLTAKARQGLIIGNPSDTVMTVRLAGGTASATAGIPLAAGTSIQFIGGHNAPDDAVSIFCAGTSKAYIAYEW